MKHHTMIDGRWAVISFIFIIIITLLTATAVKAQTPSPAKWWNLSGTALHGGSASEMTMASNGVALQTTSGSYSSIVFDAGGIADWTEFTMGQEAVYFGASTAYTVTAEMRSSIDNSTWSAWMTLSQPSFLHMNQCVGGQSGTSAASSAYCSIAYDISGLARGRYVQYRLLVTAASADTDVTVTGTTVYYEQDDLPDASAVSLQRLTAAPHHLLVPLLLLLSIAALTLTHTKRAN